MCFNAINRNTQQDFCCLVLEQGKGLKHSFHISGANINVTALGAAMS
jgi:hypothetical protein